MVTTTTGLATSFITFSRPGATGGGATVTDSDGRIKWAGHNLLTNSESFDASAWSKVSSSVTANAIVAPDGTTTADLVTVTGASGRVVFSNTFVAGVYTFGVYIKPNVVTDTNIRIFDGTTNYTLVLSWSGGVPSFVSNTGTSYTLTSAANGYYLATITATVSAGSGSVQVFVNGANSSGSSYLWGAHLYRSDLGGMVLNPARGDAYYPTTPRNLLGFTEDISNAAWGKTRSSVSSNTLVAPNGLATADTFTEDTSAGTHAIEFAARTYGTGDVFTFSCYAKAKERSWVQLEVFRDKSYSAYFNLSSGTVGATANSTSQIVSVGDGWYRCSFTFTVATGGSGTPYIFLATANSTRSYTGDGTSGIYLWGAQLSDSASLDAYSPVYGAAVTSAAYYAPRLDYDANGSALGLLVEEQRTNLATYSEAFDDAVWAGATAGIASRTANTTAAPTGTSVADTITANNALAAHYIGRSVTWTAAVHTVSVFLKYSTQQFVQLNTWDGTTARFANFDIQNGVAGTTSNATSTITSFGNGWYRCTMTGSAAQAAASGNWVICFANSNSASATPTYTTAGTEAFFVYGAQIEAGSFATSYIPTGASTATRTADVASVSTQAFPYNDVDGTVVVNFTRGSNTGNSWVWSFDSDYADLIAGNSNVNFRYGQSPNVDLTTSPQVTSAKVAAAYTRGGTHATSVNGAAATTSGVSNVPTRAGGVLALGYDAVSTGNRANIWIRQITYLPRRLSNAELQSRSV